MKAPTFTLNDQDNNSVSLPEKGLVVLYFYPKANTPGCTLEAKTFTQLLPEFIDAGAMVWGVSPDPVDKQKTFCDKHGLGITLLADENHEVAEAYGVWKPKKMFGNEYMGIVRTTFLIKDGEIVETWKHKPGKTEEKILEAINNR